MENSFDLLQEIVKLLREINNKLDHVIEPASVSKHRIVNELSTKSPLIKPTKPQLDWKRRNDVINRREKNTYLRTIRSLANDIIETSGVDDPPAFQLSAIAELSGPKKLYQHPFYQAVKAEYLHFIEATQYKAKEILKKKYSYYKALDKDFLRHNSN